MSQQINLFNPIFRQQKKYFSAATMAQALGMVLAGAILLVSYATYRSSQLGAEAREVALQLQAAQTQLAEVEAAFPPRQKNQALAGQIRKLEMDMAALQQISATLQAGEFGNTEGHAEYMRAFARQILEGVWLTGFSIHGAGAEIGLQGRALRPELVPAYINRLKREPILQGKAFSALQMQASLTKTTADAGTGKDPAPGTYMEFSLQSQDAQAQPAGAGGMGQP